MGWEPCSRVPRHCSEGVLQLPLLPEHLPGRCSVPLLSPVLNRVSYNISLKYFCSYLLFRVVTIKTPFETTTRTVHHRGPSVAASSAGALNIRQVILNLLLWNRQRAESSRGLLVQRAAMFQQLQTSGCSRTAAFFNCPTRK